MLLIIVGSLLFYLGIVPLHIRDNLSTRYETSQIYKAESINSKRDVLFGETFSESKDTLSLNEFNVKGNGTDETEAIQKALDRSEGKTLYIPQQEGEYYLVGQLIVPSNITIVCAPEVVFMAKDDLRQDISDFEVMWRFEESENVVFDGQGATFKMNKAAYSHEFNHIFMINAAKNVILKNINAIKSAGDGFYVGAVRTERKYPENITIENCIAEHSRRQGLSITSAKNLRVLNSSFNYSKGTDPQSGVDIEPFNNRGVLKDIVFKNSKAIGNQKRGFVVNLARLNKNSEPVDIIFDNCFAENNLEGFSNRGFRGVQGKVSLLNSTIKDSHYSGITESSCLANSAEREYKKVKIINSNTSNRKTSGYAAKAGIYLRANKKKNGIIGNAKFIKCKIIDDKNSQYGIYIDHGNRIYKDISVRRLRVKGKNIVRKQLSVGIRK